MKPFVTTLLILCYAIILLVGCSKKDSGPTGPNSSNNDPPRITNIYTGVHSWDSLSCHDGDTIRFYPNAADQYGHTVYDSIVFCKLSDNSIGIVTPYSKLRWEYPNNIAPNIIPYKINSGWHRRAFLTTEYDRGDSILHSPPTIVFVTKKFFYNRFSIKIGPSTNTPEDYYAGQRGNEVTLHNMPSSSYYKGLLLNGAFKMINASDSTDYFQGIAFGVDSIKGTLHKNGVTSNFAGRRNL